MTIENHSLRKAEVPLVSVIVALYNGEKFIQGLLEDLEAQTIAKKIEIIIVETGSTTNEIDVIKSFQERFDNIVYVRTGFRVNVAIACNFGIRIASGKYITLAPVDDRRRHDSFQVLSDELEAHHEVGLVYADNYVTNFENQTFNKHVRSGYKIRPEYSSEIMLSGCHMGPQAMWRRSVHEEIGFFDEVLESATDYEFWCRIATRYPMKHVPAFLGLYFDNPKGIVNSNASRNHQQTKDVQKIYEGKFPPPTKEYSRGRHYLQPMDEPRYVNICMVTFNRLEFTKSAIASILEFTCYPHVITVVDNGSTDGTVEYLRAIKQEGIITNLVLLEENVGVAKASNLAWSQEPEAKYYLKYDNDIVIQKPDWLSQMVDVIDHLPELGAIAYNFEPKSYEVQRVNGYSIRTKKSGNLNGACILIPNRTERILGYWCEDYGLYGEEDADYGERIILAGLKNVYMEDEAIGVHLPAGRAAHIEATTFKASDGVEELQFREYREFKDSLREKNVKGEFKRNVDIYRAGQKPLYVRSGFVESWSQSEGRSSSDPVTYPVQSSEAYQPIPAMTSNNQTGAVSLGRKISVIVADPICADIRLIKPLFAGIEKEFFKGQVIGEPNADGNNGELSIGPEETWVMHRTSILDDQVIKTVRSQGTRIVHDLDDLLWEIPSDNPNHNVITPEMIFGLRKALTAVDCVTVSTHPLKESLLQWGIESFVLPNCLMPGDWTGLTPQRRSGRRPRVGWAGQSKVHHADLALLNSIMEALGDEVEWVFLGAAPEFTNRTGIVSQVFPMVSMKDFPQALANLNLDLALAPLAVNTFNEAKSDLRLLQYGMLGYPVIATDIYPHRQAPVERVPNETVAWVRAIRDRIGDLDAAEVEGQKLRQWVLNNRMIDKWLPQYRSVWLGVPCSSHEESPLIRANVETPVEQIDQVEDDNETFDCSIIIPVFNKCDLTRQCLTSLAEVTQGCSYEVILVDNGSSDDTSSFLKTLGGDVKVIRNNENLGFAKACNQGAAAARGQYLVFLNNDTIPKSGWLQALVDEVVLDPDVAIVGSKLLYPDDTIQHAGVVFSKNCLIPYHVFRGAPGDLKAANLRRAFQVVTAACMLIRREEFQAVSGFDETYINGFEDVDLCLKVGKRGKQIIYQPQSVLYHLEHQTPGRKDPESERHNGKILMERWASSIVVDEDLYIVPEGYANRYVFRDGCLRQLLEPFRDETERAQWERVRSVQELLRTKEKQSGVLTEREETNLTGLLRETMQWPNDVEVLRWAAKLCRFSGWSELERQFCERVLSLNEDEGAREVLAKSMLSQGNLDEASRHIQAMISKKPDHPTGHFLSGILLMQEQRYAGAVQSFHQALAVGADPEKTQRGLGMAYMGLENWEEAWKIFHRRCLEAPDDLEATKTLLQIGTVLERWGETAGILTRHVERNPADCDMRFALAGVQYRCGEEEQARNNLEMLRLLKPDFEGLEDLARVLNDGKLSDGVPILANQPGETLPTVFDSEAVKTYYQPPSGNTEKFIQVHPVAVRELTVASQTCLKDYGIHGFGKGIEAVEAILPIVFQRQFNQKIQSNIDMWDRVAVVTIECELVHGNNGMPFSSLKPNSLEDIDPGFAQNEGEDRRNDIYSYLTQLKSGENIAPPLYIGGAVLKYLGANADEKALYMLDGARRLSACALHHRKTIEIQVLLFEEEVASLLQASVKQHIQDRIQQMKWFTNYHSLPFMGIQGQRSLRRFELIDNSLLKDSVVIDFGCNLGQASLKAIQAGAKSVWGIEGMEDTLAIAREIKHIAGCEQFALSIGRFQRSGF